MLHCINILSKTKRKKNTLKKKGEVNFRNHKMVNLTVVLKKQKNKQLQQNNVKCINSYKLL